MIRVTIERVTRNRVPYREWLKVADSGNPRDQGAIYEYVDSERSEAESHLLLKQELENIDIVAVIKALNAIA